MAMLDRDEVRGAHLLCLGNSEVVGIDLSRSPGVLSLTSRVTSCGCRSDFPSWLMLGFGWSSRQGSLQLRRRCCRQTRARAISRGSTPEMLQAVFHRASGDSASQVARSIRSRFVGLSESALPGGSDSTIATSAPRVDRGLDPDEIREVPGATAGRGSQDLVELRRQCGGHLTVVTGQEDGREGDLANVEEAVACRVALRHEGDGPPEDLLDALGRHLFDDRQD